MLQDDGRLVAGAEASVAGLDIAGELSLGVVGNVLMGWALW
jgi:hypothetical protein